MHTRILKVKNTKLCRDLTNYSEEAVCIRYCIEKRHLVPFPIFQYVEPVVHSGSNVKFGGGGFRLIDAEHNH